MGNLIIKGKGGAGNKLIIQDQAGGAVLTTADSGATIADGVALGTPASGVLTNMTFPAGHVIQTKHHTSTTADQTSTTAEPSGTAGISLGYVHITPLKANSLIWLTAHWSYHWSRTANYQCVIWWTGFKIGTGNQSGTFTTFKQYFSDYDGLDDNSDDIYRHPTLNVIHDPTYTLGQTISYEWRLGAGRGSGSVGHPTVYVRDNGTNPPSWIGVQEIAQ